MVFLIDYDRSQSKTISMRTYADDQYNQASADRLALEISLLEQNIMREVVILQAESETVIRESHSKYFYTLEEMLQKSRTPTRAESLTA